MTYPTRNNKERFDREVEIELTESEATRMKELHELDGLASKATPEGA
jgi:hypothetical protein